MSHKRSKRNTKKVLKKLKAKRQRYSFGGYGGGGIPAGYNAGEQVRREGLTTSQWEAMTGNPTGIDETKLNTTTNSKIYDLLGRELNSVPIGKMYIRNNRLCISK